MLLNSMAVAAMKNHRNTISTAPNSIWCMPKKMTDHMTFRTSRIPKREIGRAISSNCFPLFQTR